MVFRLLVIGLIAASFPAFGQEREDPRLVTYRGLLSEANDRVVTLNAQVQALTAEVQKLKAQTKATDPTVEKK